MPKIPEKNEHPDQGCPLSGKFIKSEPLETRAALISSLSISTTLIDQFPQSPADLLPLPFFWYLSECQAKNTTKWFFLNLYRLASTKRPYLNKSCRLVNPLSTNPTKWSNTLKQFVSLADELLEHVWPFCKVGTERVKYVWPFRGSQTRKG